MKAAVEPVKASNEPIMILPTSNYYPDPQHQKCNSCRTFDILTPDNELNCWASCKPATG